jgi:hypothetical protein
VIELLGRISAATSTALHPDAIAFRDRVLAAGGLIAPYQLVALSNMAQSIQSAGLRPKVWHISPLVGENLEAIAQRFYFDSTEDGPLTLVEYTLADYTRQGGLKGGWPRRIDTRIVPSLSPWIDNSLGGGYSCGMGFYCSEVNARDPGIAQTSSADIFAADNPIATTRVNLVNTDNLCRAEAYRSTAGGFVTETTATRTGFIYSTRLNNDFRLYDDGVQIASAAPANDIDIRPTLNRIRFQGNASNRYSTNRGRLYTLTLGMTNAEAIAFSNIMTTAGLALAA